MNHLDTDSDDIYRQIDLENEAERTAEVERLRKKLRGYKTHFTIAFNVLGSLINAYKTVTTNLIGLLIL